jgi:hypothetical protein
MEEGIYFGEVLEQLDVTFRELVPDPKKIKVQPRRVFDHHNRSTIKGFSKYMKDNPFYFKGLFGCSLTDDTLRDKIRFMKNQHMIGIST